MERELYHQHEAQEENHWWFVGRRRIVQSFFDSLCIGTDHHLIDVGAGVGGMLPLLFPLGTVSVMEGDAESAALIERRYGDRVRVMCRFLNGRSDIEGHDIVTMFDVLEHIRDDERVVRDVYEALPPGGLLILTVPAFPSLWSDHDRVNHHERRYVRKGITALLRSSGFRVRRVSYFNTLLFPLAVAARLFAKRGGTMRSDIERPPSRFMNALLLAVFSLERHLVSRLDLPFGVSLFICAEKPPSEHQMI